MSKRSARTELEEAVESRLIAELRRECKAARDEVFLNERAFHRAQGARAAILALYDMDGLSERAREVVRRWIKAGGFVPLKWKSRSLVPPEEMPR